MKLIGLEELRAKLDSGQAFKLVMAFSEDRFRQGHIPGSICCPTPEEALRRLEISDEIVVYCSDVHCSHSPRMYRVLTDAAYHNVRRYAGGLAEWVDAGYALESDINSTDS